MDRGHEVVAEFVRVLVWISGAGPTSFEVGYKHR